MNATHVNELRAALDQARAAADPTKTWPAYTDNTLVVGTTPVKAVHIHELRDGIQ